MMRGRLNSLHFSKDAIYQLLTLALLVSVLLVIATYTAEKHAWARQSLQDIEPRYARVLGMLDSENEMAQVQQRSLEYLHAYAYPPTTEASQIGTQTQQVLRQVFSGPDISIVSSQAMEPVTDGTLQAIPIQLQLQGNLLGLKNGLVALSKQRPLIQLDNIRITYNNKPSVHAPVVLTINARFLVWRRPE